MAPDESGVSDGCCVHPAEGTVANVGVLMEMEVCAITIALFVAMWIKRFIPGRKRHQSAHPPGSERKSGAAHEPGQKRMWSVTGCMAMPEEKSGVCDTLQPREKDGKTQEMAQTWEEKDQRFQQLPAPTTECDRYIVRLAREGHPDEARQWLQRCVEAGFQPKQGTFTTVMLAYSKMGSITQAMDVVDEMKSAGIEFDAVTYNMIIDAWGRTGDACMAQMWMRKMLAAGVGPNIVSFSIIFRVCAGAGQSENLEAWFRRAQAYSFDLSVAHIDSTAKVFAKRDDAVNATKWLKIAIEHGARPGADCFMDVLNAIAKKQDLELAIDLIDLMRAVDMQPDGTILSRCILIAAKAGHVSKAQEWADDCAARRCRISTPARQSLLRAGLRVPDFGTGATSSPKAVHAAGGAAAAIGCANCSGREDSGGLESVEEAMFESRMAAVGKTFSGTIKDFQPGRFGHIACAATRALFQRDIFIHPENNPQLLTRGQRVSFVLHVDEKRGLPQAAELALIPP